jgi:hypothetical protein
MNKMAPKPQSRTNATADSLKTVNPKLAQRVDRFLEDVDIACWYKRYFKMESDFRTRLKGNRELSAPDFCRIAKWGGLRRSICTKKDLDLGLSELRRTASINVLVDIYKRVQDGVCGFGPTYASKTLRFLSPQRCGAIDTRLVEEFGEKQREKQRRWLAWSVTRAKGAWSARSRPSTSSGC